MRHVLASFNSLYLAHRYPEFFRQNRLGESEFRSKPQPSLHECLQLRACPSNVFHSFLLARVSSVPTGRKCCLASCRPSARRSPENEELPDRFCIPPTLQNN